MVDGFRINGGKKLKGEVSVNGSKNAALPLIAATLIEEGEYILYNVPNLRDVRVMFQMLVNLGLEVTEIEKNTYKIKNNGLNDHEAPYDLVKKLRASFLVMGAILGNRGKAKVSLPGGDAIGSRPVDLHLKGFEALGAKITKEHGYILAESEELVGNKVLLDFPSVGATQNIMMAAVKAKGITTIENAAREPEIEDLGEFFVKMGAKIEGLGTSIIKIEGVKKLNPSVYSVMPDRIEAGTYMIASVLTGGEILVKNANVKHLESFIDKLEEMGIVVEETDKGLKTYGDISKLKPVKIKTMPHPGFPTDLQSQITTLLTQINGTSEIEETIFENRFRHIPELYRMNCDISTKGDIAVIRGRSELSGADVMASDIRAGASLVLAGLVADGETIVNRVYHVDRGYENMEEKLNAMGASIERIKVEA